MRSTNHNTSLILTRGKRQGEDGFALIAALLAVWLLTALGILAFAVTTQDIRTSSRTVGERKAFSAAESGINWLTQNFNPANPGNSAVSAVVVDSTSQGDPKTQYTIAAPPTGWVPTTGPGVVPVAGYAMGGGEVWGRQRFLAQVTGMNTAYNSTVQMNVGVGFGPVDISTMYR